MPIGHASNILMRDGGFDGIMVRQDEEEIVFEETRIVVSGGCSLMRLTSMAAKQGYGGLEFLSGIPGTIGGAVRMNAGAHGKEIKDVLLSFTAIDRKGQRHEGNADDFTYRSTPFDESWIVTSAELACTREDTNDIQQRMAEYRTMRHDTQPMGVRTGGSTFKNPPQHKAWKLIEEAGARGLTYGKASLSQKHCNFMVNDGGAQSHELEQLGEMVRSRVHASTGVSLEWEIRRIGKSNGKNREATDG